MNATTRRPTSPGRWARRTTTALGAALAISLTTVTAPALALGGDLWTGFSDDGIAPTGIPTSRVGNTIAVDPAADRVYQAGYATSGPLSGKIYIAAFTTDGTPDMTFSDDGLADTGITSYPTAGVGLAVDPSTHRVYAAAVSSTSGHELRMDVVALTSNGTPDPGFSADGATSTEILHRYDSGAAIAVDTVHDRVVVAAQALAFTGNGDVSDQVYLTGFDTTGALDPTFSDDGLAPSGVVGGQSAGLDLTFDAGRGRTYLSGYAASGALTNDPFVAAYDADGHLDAGFSGDGLVGDTTSSGSSSGGYGVALDLVRDRVYLSGPRGSATAFTASGALVTSFGTSGRAQSPLGQTDQGLRSDVAVEPGTGTVYVTLRAQNQAAVAGYDSRGRVHAGFGGPVYSGFGYTTSGTAAGPTDTLAVVVDPTDGTLYASAASSSEAYVAAYERANPVPISRSDSAQVDLGNSVTIDVLANDSDPEGEAIFVQSLITGSTQGSATLNADGTVTYDSTGVAVGRGESVTDTFRYWLADSRSHLQVTVTITVVGPPNAAPVAFADTATVTYPGSTTVDVLANDADADGDPLTVSSLDVEGTLGAVAVNPDGTVTYDAAGVTLAPGTSVEDSFGYTVTDGYDSATAVVTVTVSRPRLGTVLTANPAVVDRSVPQAYVAFSSTLRDVTGEPVVGRTVSYQVGTWTVCQATTDGTGFASCANPLGLVAVILTGRYTASFAGDVNYDPSTATAGAFN